MELRVVGLLYEPGNDLFGVTVIAAQMEDPTPDAFQPQALLECQVGEYICSLKMRRGRIQKGNTHCCARSLVYDLERDRAGISLNLQRSFKVAVCLAQANLLRCELT